MPESFGHVHLQLLVILSLLHTFLLAVQSLVVDENILERQFSKKTFRISKYLTTPVSYRSTFLLPLVDRYYVVTKIQLTGVFPLTHLLLHLLLPELNRVGLHHLRSEHKWMLIRRREKVEPV